MTDTAKPVDPKPATTPAPAAAAPRTATVAPATAIGTDTVGSGGASKPAFTDQEIKVAFNSLHARLSPDGGLAAFNPNGDPLPIERMTPVQRAAFERMDPLHRVPKK